MNVQSVNPRFGSIFVYDLPASKVYKELSWGNHSQERDAFELTATGGQKAKMGTSFDDGRMVHLNNDKTNDADAFSEKYGFIDWIQMKPAQRDEYLQAFIEERRKSGSEVHEVKFVDMLRKPEQK